MLQGSNDGYRGIPNDYQSLTGGKLIIRSEGHGMTERQTLLIRLASDNWNCFVAEWDRQVSFWSYEIQEAVKDSMAKRRPFDIIEEAYATLRLCGEKAVKECAVKTIEILLKPVDEAIRRLP